MSIIRKHCEVCCKAFTTIWPTSDGTCGDSECLRKSKLLKEKKSLSFKETLLRAKEKKLLGYMDWDNLPAQRLYEFKNQRHDIESFMKQLLENSSEKDQEFVAKEIAHTLFLQNPDEIIEAFDLGVKFAKKWSKK